jgi:hypothetical protein
VYFLTSPDGNELNQQYLDPAHHPEQKTFFPQSFVPQFEKCTVGIYQDDPQAAGFLLPGAGAAQAGSKVEDVFQEEGVSVEEVVPENL